MSLLRRQLSTDFSAIIRNHPKGRTTTDIERELTKSLVAAVPVERISPRNEGLFFFHGGVDEGDVVTAQYEILAAHLNLPMERKIEITLSTVGFSIFAATALIALISSIRAEHRIVRLHSVGWVSAAALAVVQSADERTIEPNGFIFLPPASSGTYGANGLTSPGAIAYQMFLKHYVERGVCVPAFWEGYPTSGLRLAAGEAVARGLFDAVRPGTPRRRAQ